MGERVARLEAPVQHLATQADWGSLKTGQASIKIEIEKIRTSFWKGLLTAVGAAAVAGASVASLIVKLMD